MSAIKLTASQKKVILALRDGTGTFSYSRFLAKFSFKGKTFRYDIGSALAYHSGLIEPIDKKANNKQYQLTELGKSCIID